MLENKTYLILSAFHILKRGIAPPKAEKDASPKCNGNKIVLYSFNQIPFWLQDNPDIRSGYRCYLNFEACLKSLFVLSNEFFNVWTHLIGFFVFAYCILFNNYHVVFSNGGTWLEWAIIQLNTCCSAVCMGNSAMYHLFKCNSETAYCHCMKMDHFGIFLALTNCLLANYCRLQHRRMGKVSK
eukprot:Nk52_evm26s1129 gene=Nk52_evmTU26s1129